jgi:hypothetical protein
VKYLERFLAHDRVHHDSVQLAGFSPESTGETGETEPEGGFAGFAGTQGYKESKVVHHKSGVQLASVSPESTGETGETGEPAWVAWARSLPHARWDAWRDRAQAIEAKLPRPGTIEAIEESMRQAWLEFQPTVEATP